MSSILAIPEIQALEGRTGLLRIPQEIDVPLTPRVRQIIDAADFHRLAHISQLGLVSLVYPAAHHMRFEHSLGVYRMALLYLRQLAMDPRFRSVISASDGETLIAAALLHDLGHWPFCHPIEDMQLPGVSSHEFYANRFLLEGEIAQTLRDKWHIQPNTVVSLLSEKPNNTSSKILKSILSGPVDIDKVDYLMRDSLHAGVPYGRNFDHQRLIASLTLNESGDGLAITEKGRTAAELMVFARYVMFSEVYWHHTVRAATAMLQRAFYFLHTDMNLDQLFRLTESSFITQCLIHAEQNPARELLQGLFGSKRQLYKRVAQYSCFQQNDIYRRLARQPYSWLTACGTSLSEILSHRLGQQVEPHKILVDAPPVKREIEFNIEVHFPKENCFRQLADVSPVVQALAHQQFDDYVKRVRIFTHPDLSDACHKIHDLDRLVEQAIERVNQL